MRIKAIVLLIALLLGSSMIVAQPGRADDDTLQDQLRNVLASGNTEELESYRKLLVELEKAKLQANDLAGATTAKLGIIKIDRELAALEGAAARSGNAASAGTDKGAAAKAAAEKAAAEKIAVEKAAILKANAEKVAAEKAAAEKAAAEEAAAVRAAAEKAAAVKATANKAAVMKAAAEKAAAEKAAAEKAAAEKAAVEKAAAEKVAAEKAAAMKAAAEKVAAEKAAAEKAAAMKAAAEKAAAEKATAMKAAAEKAAAEKAAVEKAAAMKAAAEKAAAMKVAAEKAFAEKATAEKAAAEKAAAEKTAAEKAAVEKAAAEKAASEKAAIENTAAEKVRAELDKKLKDLITEGNAKLNAGDLQGARAIKKEISKIQGELDRLSLTGAAHDQGKPGPKAENSITNTAFKPDELQNYRQMLDLWDQEKNRALAQDGANQKKVLDDYRRKLIVFGDALLGISNIEGAGTVKNKITAITMELDALQKSTLEQKSSPATAPQSSISEPTSSTDEVPQPTAKVSREPITQVSSVQGLAGAPNFSENNIYSFTLGQIGPTSTLTFYVTGRRSTDSTGNIWLITPDGRRAKAGNWSSSVLDGPATEVTTYENLKPISADISPWVKTTGTYQVEFEWTGGLDPLVIFRVEIAS